MLNVFWKKGVVFIVFMLFLGVGIQPLVATDQKAWINEDYYDVDIEFCGLGRKHTVKLTQQEADEVEQLFDDIEQRLSEVETIEEAEIIFKEAVVELDKYGLLGGLNVRQAQRLVTGVYQNKKIMNIIDEHIENNQNIFNNQTNALCLIVGETNKTSLYPPLINFIFHLAAEKGWLNLYDHPFMWLMGWAFLFYVQVVHIILGHTITLGTNYSSLYPACGWVFTIGLRGIKYWDGAFYGQLSTILPWERFGENHYIGIRGFTGIKVTDPETHEYFYLGTALRVKISYEPPDDKKNSMEV